MRATAKQSITTVIIVQAQLYFHNFLMDESYINLYGLNKMIKNGA